MLTFGVSNDCIKVAHSLLPLYSNVTSTVLLVAVEKEIRQIFKIKYIPRYVAQGT